jgi:hypothetical protein
MSWQLRQGYLQTGYVATLCMCSAGESVMWESVMSHDPCGSTSGPFNPPPLLVQGLPSGCRMGLAGEPVVRKHIWPYSFVSHPATTLQLLTQLAAGVRG